LNHNLVEIVNARGTKNPSRIKFRNVFFVDIENSKLDQEYVIFSRDDVRQLTPSISMHIKITTSKDTLMKYFQDNN